MAGNGADNILNGSYRSLRIGNKKITVKASPTIKAINTYNALTIIIILITQLTYLF